MGKILVQSDEMLVAQPLHKMRACSVAGDSVKRRTAAANYRQLKKKTNKAKLPLNSKNRNKTTVTGHAGLF